MFKFRESEAGLTKHRFMTSCQQNTLGLLVLVAGLWGVARFTSACPASVSKIAGLKKMSRGEKLEIGNYFFRTYAFA